MVRGPQQTDRREGQYCFLKLVSPAYNLLGDFRPVSGKKQSVFLCPSSIIFALKCVEMWREVSVKNKNNIFIKMFVIEVLVLRIPHIASALPGSRKDNYFYLIFVQ